MLSTQLLRVAVLLLLANVLSAVEIPPIPEYQVGDLAEATIVTPVELSIADPGATRHLRESKAQNLPSIYRFYPQAAAEAEADLRAAFKSQHDYFLRAVQQCYRRGKLNAATIQHESFGAFMAWVQKQNPAFPCATNLARAWAAGESGDQILQELVSKLRSAMQHYIRSDSQAEGTGQGAGAILVFATKPAEAFPDLEQVEKRSHEIPLEKTYTVSEARRELVKSFSPAEKPLGLFLSKFLKENCSYDQHLSARIEKRKTAAIWAMAHYEPGEVIVNAGQAVDARAKAALEALEDRRGVELRKSAAARRRAEKIQNFKDWMGGLCAVCLGKLENAEPTDYALWSALIGMLLVFYLVRRESRKPKTALPVPVAHQPVSYTVILNPEKNETIFLPGCPASTAPADLKPALKCSLAAPESNIESQTLTDSQWLERARDAEKRAEDLLSQVRAGLAPHLARELMNRLVQELISQRISLLQTQKVAEHEIGAIEKRFTAIYEQLQEQLTSYEKRAHDLEGKLATKDLENSELLKAMIVTQKKLHSTQSGNTGK